ncbi:MAG: insulinase family protein [Bacteroidales bacterium]|nr:insulinase family protein [Bacteroidales bacterium]
MHKLLKITAAGIMLLAACACGRYSYETVADDPLQTKIYTLDNGLKVYMTVNKETPRLQTAIAVRVGGKNDPADNTGLAHYLEHIMFKGTQQFGTSDYAAEKPLLDEIQALYDLYRTKTDPVERAAIYHQIDSISYEASKIAIPNEYDKLMSIIGSEGSNAFTSEDVTCYVEDIPSNQVENWAKVQADRFKNMVVRGFHTELEAVYEEKNMGMNDDNEKALDAVAAVLFPNHPYGTQTVIGTQDHLKNPSITAILKQKATYYVPNNTAICVSGDFDPDAFVAVIERYFSDWEPNPDIPVLEIPKQEPLPEPVVRDIYGTEAEFTMLSWRYPGVQDPDSEVAEIVSGILYNGMAGLLDLDLNQQQKLLGAYSFNYGRTDYGELILEGLPQDGQSLQDVRDLLLGEVAKLREGDFDDDLVEAVVANLKLREMSSLESNRARAMKLVYSFIGGNAWAHDALSMQRLEKVTKEDVVAWARKYLGAGQYALVYKHLGEDKNIYKIDAPKITPIVTNREMTSDFLRDIQEAKVKPIEPVFTDYSRDMASFHVGTVPVLYKRNETNDIASLTYVYDKGSLDDAALSMAYDYVAYLGTPDCSAEEFARKMYALACSWSASVSDERTLISVSGLSENLDAAMDLVEDLLQHAQGDEDVLDAMKADEMQSRANNRLDQRACRQALSTYLRYGEAYVRATTLTDSQLAGLRGEDLLGKVREMTGCAHEVLYFGPATREEVNALLSEHHDTDSQLQPLTLHRSTAVAVTEPEVLLVPYQDRQFDYIQYSCRGESFDPEADAAISLFNEYFGGGMNTIVFQEMRESRALAYSAGAYLRDPDWAGDAYTFTASIGSQNDKLRQAVEAFDDIINDMPLSEKAFAIAKTALETRLRTNRTTGYSVLLNYLSDRDLGIAYNRSEKMFGQLPALTLDDLQATQRQWIKDRTYRYGIVGDPQDLDLAFLSTLGPVRQLTLDEVFGYK